MADGARRVKFILIFIIIYKKIFRIEHFIFSAANYNDLPTLLSKYQNPTEADALTKLQMDLDETKIILHGTIESVLQRGEKLDDLVAKSEDLGLQSKTFYKTAKKTNACCSYM